MWRDVLPVHPAAELFPPMAPDELKALAADIKENGLRTPAILVEDDDGNPVLLDGCNRLDALELIGEEITLDKSVIFDRIPADIDPVAYVISANIRRRHLKAKDKRNLIAKLIKKQPEKSDRQIAAQLKASPTTVGTVRAKMEAVGDVSKLDTRQDTRGRSQPAARAKKRRRDVDDFLAEKRPNQATESAVVDVPTEPQPTKPDEFKERLGGQSAFVTVRWKRDADAAAIAKCILGVLKHEPHTSDLGALVMALQSVCGDGPPPPRSNRRRPSPLPRSNFRTCRPSWIAGLRRCGDDPHPACLPRQGGRARRSPRPS